MVNFNSPDVYTIEKDISQYSPSLNSSIVGILGFASKGPTNVATSITDQEKLVKTFGKPHEDIYGQGLEGSLEILEATNQIYYVRASDADTEADASAVCKFGSCPAVIVSGNLAATGEAYGIGTSVWIRAQVWDNNGVAKYSTPKVFAVLAGTYASTDPSATQANALRKVIGGGLDSQHIGAYAPFSGTAGADGSGYIVGSYAGSGAIIALSAYSDADLTTTVSAFKAIHPMAGIPSSLNPVGGPTFVPVVSAYGCSIMPWDNNAGISYRVVTIHPGAGYNYGLTTGGNVSGNQLVVGNLGGENFSLAVHEDGAQEEYFKANLLNKGGYFLEDIIQTGETDLKSSIIKGSIYSTAADIPAVTKNPSFCSSLYEWQLSGGSTRVWATGKFLDVVFPNCSSTASSLTLHDYPRFVKLVASSVGFRGGVNGIPTSQDDKNAALIGTADGATKTGMQTFDDETLNISMAIVPGVHNQSVQNALVTLAESSQNFLAVLSPPYGVGGAQNANDWSNGQSNTTGSERTAALNSSYAALYWPWVQTYSVYDKKDRWYDPAVYAVRQMAYTDTITDPWFAPAGFNRGRLTKPSDVEVKLNKGDRDALYSGGNVINPLVNFPQQGITIWGQRTTQRNPTALDRVNVRRMMIQVRKLILATTRQFVFEPNDEFTWEQIEDVTNSLLSDIKHRRGITEFRVVCDETTNTAVRIDRNEMWCKVLIKPTKTAEMIVFEINLTNQSADLGTL